MSAGGAAGHAGGGEGRNAGLDATVRGETDGGVEGGGTLGAEGAVLMGEVERERSVGRRGDGAGRQGRDSEPVGFALTETTREGEEIAGSAP